MLVLIKVASKHTERYKIFCLKGHIDLVFKLNYRLHFFKYVSSQIFRDGYPILSNFLKVFYRSAEQCCDCINYHTIDLMYYLIKRLA